MRALGLVLSLAASACAVDGPRLTSVSPAAGAAGVVVTITGTGLCGAEAVGPDGACQPLPAGYVSFGIDPQIDGVVTAWSDTQIGAVVPAGVAPGEVQIVVTVDARSSNGVSFQVR